MRFPVPVECAARPWARYRPSATAIFRRWVQGWVMLIFGVATGFGLLVAAAPVAAAEQVELTALDLGRDEDGVFLNYTVALELSRSVEDALNKGVPLFFVAEAQVFRDRWYRRDRRVADVVRVW